MYGHVHAMENILLIAPKECNLLIRAEKNNTDIRIFVRFAIFEHNLCYSTIRLQPHAYFSTTWSWDAHNWWNIFSY